MRIEGLWASSPPTPVWPGSAQTALLFVGLPLLIALVLMAAPLHDGTAPVARQDAAEQVADPAVPDPRISEAVPVFPARRAAAAGRARPEIERVPAVIFETRRTLPAARMRTREAPRVWEALRVSPSTLSSRRRPVADPVRLTAVVATAELRTRPLFAEHQSP